MKKAILGVALVLLASAASAGALLDPVTDTQVIVESTSSSVDHSFLPPLIFLMFVGVVLFF